MANIMALKRRIKTAQNVSKTTKAMQMIAASKLKKAQNAAVSSRLYVDKLTEISKNLAKRVEGKNIHPYFKPQATTEKTLLIIFSPDRGLCGSLVTNLTKEYLPLSANENIFAVNIGKKIEKLLTRSKNTLVASFPLGTSLPTMDAVFPLISLIHEYYLGKKVNSVQILFSAFESFFTQKPKVATILPLHFEAENNTNRNDFLLFEPRMDEILPVLLKRYLENALYQQLLESYVSEQAARMLAMQNATDNAKDVVLDLTLEYNKARQAQITSEILDITGASISAYE